MPLEPLRIIKNWMKNLRTREQCWDEIADKVTAFAGRTNNNLKQLGLDIGGSSYDFNNNGVRTQTTPITTRLSALESVEYAFGIRNLGLDLTDPAKVKIVSSDGTDLSSSNKGYVTFNSTTDAGQLVTREITANIEVTLTGCHWGFGTAGDLSDQILHIMMIDTGSQAILGVGIQGGRQTVTQADDETVATSVTTESKVLVSSALSAENNCIYLGYVKANFDDTGNANGEDYWEIQTGVGDVNVGRGEPSLVDGRFTGDASVGDDLTVGGDATVGGGLEVVGETTLTGDVTMGDDCDVGGNLTVGGTTFFQPSGQGFRNVGLDVSDTTKVTIAYKDSTALSSSNVGYVSIRSTSNPGRLVERQLTSNLSVTLTGAHWEYGAGGDLSDVKLYIILIDNGGDITLGVTILPWLTHVLSANCETTSTNVTISEKILVSSAVGSDSTCTYFGWVKADFDDTGGASEDLWTIQTGVSDIAIGTDICQDRDVDDLVVGPRGVAISGSNDSADPGTGAWNGIDYVDIVTTGRPVFLMIMDDGDSAGITNITNPSADAYLRWTRDGTALTYTAVDLSASTMTSLAYVDNPPVGYHRYYLQSKSASGFAYNNIKIVAFEL